MTPVTFPVPLSEEAYRVVVGNLAAIQILVRFLPNVSKLSEQVGMENCDVDEVVTALCERTEQLRAAATSAMPYGGDLL